MQAAPMVERAVTLDSLERGFRQQEVVPSESELIVTGQDFFHAIKLAEPANRTSEGRRISALVVGIEHSPVEHVARNEVPPLPLMNGDVPRRVARSVDDQEPPSTELDHVTVFEQPGWLAPVRLPALNSELGRRRLRKWVEHQVRPLAFQRLGDTVPQPICVERMDELLVEKSVSSYVIPMNVRGHNDDRQIGKHAHGLAQVGDPGPGVHKCRAINPNEQVAMDMLPMTILSYCEGGLVDRLNAEPVEGGRSGHY